MFRKIFFLILILSFWTLKAQNPFIDVNKNDFFYNDLDYLYNAWVIKDTPDHKFNPNSLIKRDEYVATVVWVWCKECINPTIEDILKFSTDPFVDLTKENPYFYCIAKWKEEGIIQWYTLDASWKYTCQNNVVNTSVPFCPENNITRIEATTILLRSAKLLVENTNSVKTINIADVDDKYYQIAKKWIEVWLIKIDNQNKVYPNEFINKKEFISMAAKTFWLNSCELKQNDNDNKLSSEIKIFDSNNKNSCIWWGELSEFNNTTNSYDFYWYTESTGDFIYKWEFINMTSWEKIVAEWKCLNDFLLKESWVWLIQLTLTDKKTWASSISYSQISNIPKTSSGIAANITWNVTSPWTNLKSYDFQSILNNASWNYTYSWDFWDWKTSSEKNPTHVYDSAWTYLVKLNVTDSSWNTSSATYNVSIGNSVNNISAGISANPITWQNPLKVNFDSITNASWNATYSWDFWDGSKSFEKDPEHVFSEPWYYNVILKIYDSNWNVWVSQVVIEVLETLDRDQDSVLDSVDYCPEVKWPASNDWCPIITEFNWIFPFWASTNSWTSLPFWIMNKCLAEKSAKNGFIDWLLSCNQCPCGYDIKFLSDIRWCDIIFPAITSPNKNSIYSRGAVYQIR